MKSVEIWKQLSGILCEQGINDSYFATIRYNVDKTMFRLNTAYLNKS